MRVLRSLHAKKQIQQQQQEQQQQQLAKPSQTRTTLPEEDTAMETSVRQSEATCSAGTVLRSLHARKQWQQDQQQEQQQEQQQQQLAMSTQVNSIQTSVRRAEAARSAATRTDSANGPSSICKQTKRFFGFVKNKNGGKTKVQATLFDYTNYKTGQALKKFYNGYTACFASKNVTSNAFTICFTLKPPAHAVGNNYAIDYGRPFSIELGDVPSNAANVNFKIPFYDEGLQWYERFYQLNEKLLWVKRKRARGSYLYKCKFCHLKIRSLQTLKSHINGHLNFFPFDCDVCGKSYPGSNSLKYHQRSQHKNTSN